MEINNIERELIKKLTFLHLKRCDVVNKEKLNLSLSLNLIQSYSPMITDSTFDKIITFLSKNKSIISLIDKNCVSSSLYRQPVIYLLIYLRLNFRNDFHKYWNYKNEELERLNKDIKLFQNFNK